MFVINKSYLNEKSEITFKSTQKENITYKIIKVVKEKNRVKYITPFFNHEIPQSNTEFNTSIVLRQTQQFPNARYIEENGRLAVATNMFSSFTSKDEAIAMFNEFKSKQDFQYRLYECTIPKDTKYIFGDAIIIVTIDNVATDVSYKTIATEDLILTKDITESL